MNIIERYKKEIIVICVIIEIILVPLIVRNIISLKNRDSNDNNIPSFNEIGKQEFGIMYRDNDTDSYKAYSGSIVDAINNSYELNLTNSKCSDGSGATVTPSSVLSISGSTVTVKSNKTVYCTLYFDLKKEPELVTNLRKKDPSGTLSKDIVGDMYRYQGTGDVPNWICFGTTENCGTSDDLIKKYMYRIIGITEEGEMKLIKETFVEEGSVTGFAWNDEYMISGSGVDVCPNGICPEWNEADLFQRINGTANGTKSGSGDANDRVDNDTDIFVDSTQYDYLRSGDSYNGGTASTWYNLITEHEWMYGDTVTSSSSADTYNGDNVYQIETGQKETTHYVQQPAGSTTVVEETYKWPTTNKVKAKISLMYIHDYIYASLGGNPGSYSTAKNAWIYYGKDSLNPSGNYEWLSTRWGVESTGIAYVEARAVPSNGRVNPSRLYNGYGVRPVFYLSSEATIKDGGEGTKTNPFILDVK